MTDFFDQFDDVELPEDDFFNQFEDVETPEEGNGFTKTLDIASKLSMAGNPLSIIESVKDILPELAQKDGIDVNLFNFKKDRDLTPGQLKAKAEFEETRKGSKSAIKDGLAKLKEDLSNIELKVPSIKTPLDALNVASKLPIHGNPLKAYAVAKRFIPNLTQEAKEIPKDDFFNSFEDVEQSLGEKLGNEASDFAKYLIGTSVNMAPEFAAQAEFLGAEIAKQLEFSVYVSSDLPDDMSFDDFKYYINNNIELPIKFKADEHLANAKNSLGEIAAWQAENMQMEGKGYGASIGSAIPSLGTAVLTTLVTRSPHAAAALFGSSSFLDTYSRARKAGVGMNEALPLAAGAGSLDYALEKVGLDVMFDSRIASGFKKVAINAFSEGMQEGSQAFKDNVITRYGGIDTATELAEGVGMSIFAGAMTGGVTGISLGKKIELEDFGASPQDIKLIEKAMDKSLKKKFKNTIKILTKDLGNLKSDEQIEKALTQAGVNKDAIQDMVEVVKQHPQVAMNLDLNKLDTKDVVFKEFSKEDIDISSTLKGGLKTIGNRANRLNLGFLNLSTKLNMLGNDFTKHLDVPVRQMTKNFLTVQYDRKAKLRTILKKHGFNSLGNVKEYGGVKLNNSMLIDAILKLQNKEDTKILKESNKFSDETIADILEEYNTNEEVQGTVKEFKLLYQEMYEDLAISHKLGTGETLGFTKDYVPRVFKKGQGKFFDFADVLTIDKKKKSGKSVTETSTKSRKKGKKPPFELDAFNHTNRYIETTARYQAYKPGFKNVMGLWGKMEPGVTAKTEASYSESIRKNLTDVMVGIDPQNNIIAESASLLRKLSYPVHLWGNVKVWENQIASIPNAAEIVGWNRMSKQLLNIAQNPQLIDQMLEESIFIKTSYIDPTMQDLQSNLGYAKDDLAGKTVQTLEVAAKAGMAPIGKIDKYVKAASYFAAKEQFLVTEPGNEAGAAEYAETVVTRTQPMSQTYFRPEVTRTNELSKQLFMYQTQRLQIYNRLVSQKARAKKGEITKAQLSRTYMNQIIIPALMITASGSYYLPDEVFDEDFLEEMVMNLTVVAPLVSAFASQIKYSRDGSISLTGLAPIEFGINAAQNIKKGEIADASFNLLDMGLSKFGLARKPFVKAKKAYDAMVTGEDTSDVIKLFLGGRTDL